MGYIPETRFGCREHTKGTYLRLGLGVESTLRVRT